MSLQYMNWAWQRDLPTLAKLVLLRLADHANEEGSCHPSISALARSCSASERTIQRAIQDLCERGLIEVTCRYRDDGGQRSNQYRLISSADMGARMSSPSDKRTSLSPSTTPSATPQGDFDDTQTTMESKTENPQQHSSGEWIFPKDLSMAEQRFASAAIRGLDGEVGQLVLDELAGRLCKGTVKSPLSYLRQLVKSARAGSFVPEVALSVRQRRAAETAYARRVAAPVSDLQPNASGEALGSLPESLRHTMLKIKHDIERRRDHE